VNAGQVDVGQVQVGLLGAARAQGAPLKAIATIMPKTDLCVLVDKTSPMTKAADLKGKTVVVFAASPWAPLIDPYLKSGGLNRETAKIDFVDPAALWGTYIAKRADGLMSTASSAVPVAEASRPSKCLWASDAGLNFMSYGLVVKEDTIAKRGPALKKLIETQQKAWEQIRKDPEVGVKAMLAARPDARLDPAVQKNQIVMSLDFFETPATKGTPIGWQATADWEATLKTLEAAGVVKPGWKASDYFTNALMD
jgi:NitT/TauT family transport system substrate-binding protein